MSSGSLLHFYAATFIVHGFSASESREGIAMDLLFLVLTGAFFALTAALVYGCERLRGKQ